MVTITVRTKTTPISPNRVERKHPLTQFIDRLCKADCVDEACMKVSF